MSAVLAPAAHAAAHPDRPDRRRLLHAHPDDEAIFTAATMHRLARRGARVVLVTATAGELGPVLRPLRRGETLPGRRRAELERAAAARRGPAGPARPPRLRDGRLGRQRPPVRAGGGAGRPGRRPAGRARASRRVPRRWCTTTRAASTATPTTSPCTGSVRPRRPWPGSPGTRRRSPPTARAAAARTWSTGRPPAARSAGPPAASPRSSPPTPRTCGPSGAAMAAHGSQIPRDGGTPGRLRRRVRAGVVPARPAIPGCST